MIGRLLSFPFKIISFFILLALIHALKGQVYTVESQRQFNKYVKKEPYQGVLFYSVDSKEMRRNKETKERYAAFKNLMKQTSDTTLYKEGGLLFMSVNMAKQMGKELAELYGIRVDPSFLLLYRGRPLDTEDKSVGLLTQFQTREELSQFIDTTLKAELNEIVTQKENMKKQRALERQIWYASPAFYWDDGYPTYYDPDDSFDGFYGNAYYGNGYGPTGRSTSGYIGFGFGW